MRLTTVEDIDHAPVGKYLHDQVGDLPQPDLRSERLVEQLADLHQQAQAPQSRAERAFGLERGVDGHRALALETVAVGDVDLDPDELGGGSVRISDHPGSRLDPADAAVGQHDAVLRGVLESVGLHRLVHRVVEPRAVVRVDPAPHRLVGALEGTGRHGIQLLHGGVPVHVARPQVPAPGPRPARAQGSLEALTHVGLGATGGRVPGPPVGFLGGGVAAHRKAVHHETSALSLRPVRRARLRPVPPPSVNQLVSSTASRARSTS